MLETMQQKMQPYSMSIKDATEHFGFSAQAFYDMIHKGQLHRGHHYLKVGKKVVILRDEFISWMRSENGG